jgi:UDP-N-acetylmuramate dehydrogenase
MAGVRTWILGRGSNVLVSDQGLHGVVVCLGGDLAEVRRQGTEDGGRLTGLVCGAGASLDEVATFAEQQGLVGAGFLAGIPGTVGGGMHSNAGAFGRSLGDIVTSVTVLDDHGEEFVRAGSQIRREYRRPMVDEGLIVVEVTLGLERPTADGRQLAADEVRKQRWGKHPTEPSAGSFFRNPEKDGERIPAGKLIEECGLKGRSIGGAKVSEVHANFLVNSGRARFADVYELAQVIKATVEERTGILLEEEVQYLPGPDERRFQNAEGRIQESRSGAANGS